jgi:hypothetical protein
MSTTFGIHKLGENINLEDDYLTYDSSDLFIKVAFRGNGTGMRWTNDVAKFLPDDLKVYPLDNSSQGIYTIGDIKNEIKKNNHGI